MQTLKLKKISSEKCCVQFWVTYVIWKSRMGTPAQGKMAGGKKPVGAFVYDILQKAHGSELLAVFVLL